MATLEKIRSKSGLLIAVIAIALLCFIIGGVLNDSSSSFGQSKEKVGEVNGNEIVISDFNQQIETADMILKMSSQMPVQDGDARDLVWNTFVQSSLLKGETDLIGMVVTVSELKEATIGDRIHPIMRQIPIFYNENEQFDINRVHGFLSSLNASNEDSRYNEEVTKRRNYWLFWEDRIKTQLLAEKYQILLLNSLSVPKAEIQYLSEITNSEVNFAFAGKAYYELADSLFVPSEADMLSKYNKTKEMYKTDAYRKMKVIVYDIVPSSEDYTATYEKVKGAEDYLKTVLEDELPLFVSQESDQDAPFISCYRAESDIDNSLRAYAFSAPKDSVIPTFLDGDVYKTAKVLSNVEMRPDSAKISRIVISGTSFEAAKKLSDSLMTEINKGADFASLAKIYSVDQTTKNKGGEFGWLREGDFGLDTFDIAVFNAKTNDVVSIETQQAIFLIKVLEKTAPVKKVKLAVISNKVEAGMDTYRDIYEKANQFIVANQTKKDFEDAALKQNLPLRELGPMYENQTNIYMVEQGRPVVKWAFEHKVDDITEKPFEFQDKCVIGFLAESVDEGYNPLEASEVNNKVKSEVINDMKSAQLISQLSSVTDLSSISGRVDTAKGITFYQTSIPGIGADNVIPVVATTALNVNQFSSPIKGANGVYVLQVLDKKVADAVSSQIENRENQNIRRSLGSMFGVLKDKAEIEDNRSSFY